MSDHYRQPEDYREQAQMAKEAYNALTELLSTGIEWINDFLDEEVDNYHQAAGILDQDGEFVLGEDALVLADALQALESVMGRAYSRSKFDA